MIILSPLRPVGQKSEDAFGKTLSPNLSFLFHLALRIGAEVRKAGKKVR